MRQLKTVSLALVCSLLTSVYFASDVLGSDGQVRIVNTAAESIKEGQLEVCGQKLTIGELEQGRSKIIQYKVKSDSHFKLAVKFASGRTLSREMGYVTSGRDFKHVLTLKENDAFIEMQ